jgi:hypothetical protein
MRSSKNRSRSKGNRNRSVGNIVNRVFESSGPEGKVRGTPQQIIDKYNQLTRDAQLSNDRVAAENFQQHAEHYLRMLAEAQREQDARQQQQGGQQQQRDRFEGGSQRDGQQADGDQPQHDARDRAKDTSDQAQAPEPASPARNEPRGEFNAVIDAGQDGDSGLVETPESAPKPKRSRARRPKKTDDTGQQGGNGDGSPDTPKEAAE